MVNKSISVHPNMRFHPVFLCLNSRNFIVVMAPLSNGIVIPKAQEWAKPFHKIHEHNCIALITDIKQQNYAPGQ